MPWFETRFATRPLVTTALALAPLLIALPAGSECIHSTLDDPQRKGPTGQALEVIYHRQIDDLYASGGATRRLDIGGVWHQVPPWFDSSTACESGNLKSWGEVTAPSFSDYVVNLDELSELAIVVSLGDDESRMREIDNTVQVLSPQSDHAGLPCWIARVNHGVGSIECLSGDTASDATARLALSYYYAAANPNFSDSSRGAFLNRARAVFDAHVLHEYADLGCQVSGVTGNTVCRWIAGGANAAAGTLRMWIGYFQDIAQLLLAAYHDSQDALDLDHAEQVVDQFLMASEFDQASLSVGRRDFTWDLSGSEPAPANPEGPDYWPWVGNNAWDEADAPRALWVGHVLRSRELMVGGAPAPAFAALAEWVQQMIDTGTHTATTSCVQYGHDGT